MGDACGPARTEQWDSTGCDYLTDSSALPGGKGYQLPQFLRKENQEGGSERQGKESIKPVGRRSV